MSTFVNTDHSVVLQQAEALSFLRRLPTGSVDLVCSDPPWNTGHRQVLGDLGYDDKYPNFKAFLYPVLQEMQRVCSSITIIHMGTTEAHYVKVWMDEIWGRRAFQGELIMYSELGRSGVTEGWPQRHSHILIFGPSGRFNPEHLPTTMRKAPKPGYEDVKPVGSVLTVNMSTSDPERVGYPSQKKLSLVMPLVQCYSQVGDLVLDPFVGGGSTADAAMRTGRRVLCCDQNPQAVAITQARLGLSLQV